VAAKVAQEHFRSCRTLTRQGPSARKIGTRPRKSPSRPAGKPDLRNQENGRESNCIQTAHSPFFSRTAPGKRGFLGAQG
jgi:hypothetical protein